MGGGMNARAKLAKDGKPLPILELPSPVWCNLLQNHLDPKDRAALFRTSKLLSEVVVKHAAQVTLSPSQHLIRDLAKRETAFHLCKACASVHMVIRWLSPALPSAGPLLSLLSGITQLTLHHIVLNSHVVRKLQLAQLSNLRTLALTTQVSNSWTFKIGGLDADALSDCVHKQAGLRALRAVRCEAADEADLCTALEKLSSIVGSQLTHLTVNHMAGLKVLPSFTALRCLHVKTGRRHGAAETAQATPLPKQLLTNLFSHPNLREVLLPELDIKKEDDCSKCETHWDLLQLQSAVTEQVLARLPLAGIQQLKVHGGLTASTACTEDHQAALQNLSKCPSIEWLPVTGDPANVIKGIPRDVPTFSLASAHISEQLLALCCTPADGRTQLSGALELMCAKVSLQQALALDRVPASIHTLCLSCWCVDPPLRWVDVWGMLPGHIEHLILNACDITQQCLSKLFDITPASLSRLTLTPQLDALDWIFQHEHEMADMANECCVELIVHHGRTPAA